MKRKIEVLIITEEELRNKIRKIQPPIIKKFKDKSKYSRRNKYKEEYNKKIFTLYIYFFE
jgi:hypothetical protein